MTRDELRLQLEEEYEKTEQAIAEEIKVCGQTTTDTHVKQWNTFVLKYALFWGYLPSGMIRRLHRYNGNCVLVMPPEWMGCPCCRREARLQ